MATIEEQRAELQARHNKETIARAAAILAERGCRYKIVEPDGTEHVNAFNEKSRAVREFNFVRDTDYIKVIAEIPDNGSDIIIVPENMRAEREYIWRLRSTVVARCTKVWGKGAFAVEVQKDKSSIHIKRIFRG